MTRPARIAPWLAELVTPLAGVTLLLAAALGTSGSPVGNFGGGMPPPSGARSLLDCLNSEQPVNAKHKVSGTVQAAARTASRDVAFANTASSPEVDLRSRWAEYESQGSGGRVCGEIDN